jgi:hypothetical protein
LLLAGAASVALALAGGVAAAQTRADDDVAATVAQAQADAAKAIEDAGDAIRMAQADVEQARRDRTQARIQAQAARTQASAARSEARRVIEEHGVHIERDGDVTIIHAGHDGADRAQHLRNILQLRPNQEAALTAYLAAMKPKDVSVHMEKMDDGPKTTPERLARMEQRLAERQAEQRGRIEAIRRFYNQLDAAQKKAFDELPPMGMGGEVRIIRTGGPGMPHVMFPPERFAPPPPPMPPVPPVPPSL